MMKFTMSDLKMNNKFWADYMRDVYIPAIEYFSNSFFQRLLPAFGNLESEADQISEKEFQRLLSLPGDENDDGAELAEITEEVGICWYKSMYNMRQATINLQAVGIFHLFEQQIYELARLALHLGKEQVNSKSDSTKQAFKKAGIDFKTFRSWKKVYGELRLIANTVKHAEGWSCSELKNKRPELFVAPSLVGSSYLNEPDQVFQPLAGENLYLTEDHLREYITAIKEFWSEFSSCIELLRTEKTSDVS